MYYSVKMMDSGPGFR